FRGECWLRLALVSLALCLIAACGKDEAQTRGASGSTAKGGGGTVQLADASRKFLVIEPVAASENPQGRSYFGRTAFRPKALSAVTSPFAGRIATVVVEPGQRINSGATLFTVESGEPDGLWVGAEVPEGEAAQVTKGTKAEVTISALNMTLQGRVAGIAPRSDAETRRAPFYVELESPPEDLRAGLLVRVTVFGA